MISPRLSRRLLAIREGAIPPDSPQARLVMEQAFRQDPTLGARLLHGVSERHLTAAMKSAGLNAVEVERALSGQRVDPAIEDPFAAPAPHSRADARADARAKADAPRAADDAADQLRAPVKRCQLRLASLAPSASADFFAILRHFRFPRLPS